MQKPEHLYTPTDVRKTRQKLLEEQGGTDALTGLPLASKDAVLDHNHKTHYVRGVIHRQANAVLGKIENMWTRYLKFWYTGTLSSFLRSCADYLERRDDHRYIHPGWLRGCQTKFNALNESQKKKVLVALAQPEGDNAKQRKELFRKALNSKRFTLTQIEHILKGV